MRHEPGPWEIDEDGYLRAVVSQVRIARIADARPAGVTLHGPFCPTRTADQRLIASAPELLTALKSCLQYLEGDGFHRETEILEARAAIAKATTPPTPATVADSSAPEAK